MEKTGVKVSYTRRQWLTICTLCSLSFANNVCISIYSPFYPQEAEKKGATATEYGFVYGIFELFIFTSSPFFGKYIDKFGAKVVLSIGTIAAGAGTMLFGLLYLVNDRVLFIALSFLTRVIHSLGSAASTIAGFSTIIATFPDSPGTNVALLDSMTGFGFIVGPLIGGYLFKIGGFVTPFMALGTYYLLHGFLVWIAIPDVYNTIKNDRIQAQILTILKIPSVFFLLFGVVAAAIGAGFISAILEPHVRQFNLGPMETGTLFTISSISYPLASLIVGRLCDIGFYPKKLVLVGSFLVIVSFTFIGPLPYIPTDTMLWMVCLGLLLNGLAYGSVMVSAFIASITSAVGAGFAEDMTTFGIITGVWTSANALGGFLGSSVSGVLYDLIGFRQATLVVIAVNAIFLAAMSHQVFCSPSSSDNSVYSSVESSDTPPLITNSTKRDYGTTSDLRFILENPLNRCEFFNKKEKQLSL